MMDDAGSMGWMGRTALHNGGRSPVDYFDKGCKCKRLDGVIVGR